MKKFIIRIIASLLVLAAVANTSICYAFENPKVQDCFELPISGTTGYGVIDLNMRSGDGSSNSKVATIPAGQPFCILSEGNTYFQVKTEDGVTGWVHKNYTMVNLPDLIPSIRYNATNSYDSMYRSCGEAMENLTGKALYVGKTENAKLGYAEYNMPVLYGMAKKIASAQSAAMADGYTLVLYEAFRPRFVQDTVNVELQKLIDNNPAVCKAVTKSGWSKSWFIAKSVSNHQKGFAIDVSLAQITEISEQTIDGRPLTIPTQYSEVEMPTAMHELSPAAASLAYGVDSKSATAWKSVPMASTMTDGAKLLRDYCTNAGMSPLASEWWHFNDLDARTATNAAGSGLFAIEKNLSIPNV